MPQFCCFWLYFGILLNTSLFILGILTLFVSTRQVFANVHLDKKIAVTILMAIVAISGCSSQTAQAPKMYHVGALVCLNYFYPVMDGFKEEMTALGYVEGVNITYDIYNAPNEVDSEMEGVLQGYVDDKVDLIVVAPTAASIKAKDIVSGTGIPVVFASSYTDGNDLIDNVKAPGNNITGVRWTSSADLGVVYLETIHDIDPKLRRVWFPFEDDYPSLGLQHEVLKKTAPELNMTLVDFPVSGPEDIIYDLTAREKLDDLGIDVMVITASPTAMVDARETVTNFSQSHRIPIVGGGISLFNMAPLPYDTGRDAAYLADKVLRGINAGTIPVITADNVFTLYYNNTQFYGIDVDEGVLAKADNIIR